VPFCTLPCGDSKRDELPGEDLRKPVLKLPPGGRLLHGGLRPLCACVRQPTTQVYH